MNFIQYRCNYAKFSLRDQSLIMGGGGGLQNGRWGEGGGGSEVLPLQKGGREKVSAILKEGARKVLR